MTRNEKERCLEIAKDAFLKAAAALVDWRVEKDALPLALLEGAIGLQQVAKADEDRRALDRVTKYLEAAKEAASTMA